MARNIVKQLKKLKYNDVVPNTEWLKSNREILLSQIKNTRTSFDQVASGERFWSGMSVFVPQKIVLNVIKPLAILLIVAIVGTSGWITAVDAAYEALPGDWLYTAKRVMEKTQLTGAEIMNDTSAATKLHAEFAKRRASEVKKVIKSDLPNKEVKVAAGLADLREEIASVTTGLEEIKLEKEANTVELAKEVQKNTEKIKNDLGEVKDDLSLNTSTASQELTKEIVEAKAMSKEIEVKVVEVVVVKHLESGSSITKEDVQNVVNSVIKSSMNDLATSKNETDTANGVIDTAKATLASSTLLLATSTVSVVKPIVVVTSTLENASIQVKTAVEQNTTASTEVDKKIIEAKAIIQTGSITDVVSKVQEIANIVKENTINVATTMATVKDSLKPATTVVGSTATVVPAVPVAPATTAN
jgi:hypothetical protein